MHWLDVTAIAEALLDAHPDFDPTQVSFPTLKSLVLALNSRLTLFCAPPQLNKSILGNEFTVL